MDLREIFGPGGFTAFPLEPDTPAAVEIALDYAAMGWPVFPCHNIEPDGKCSCQGGASECRTSSPGKHPRTLKGFKDASTDEAKIRQWWSMWPEANIAIATGAESGVMVVDVDPRNDGDTTIGDLIRNHGPIPDTVTAVTGGGGTHYVFRYRKGFRMRKLQGVDFKTDGGYIIAPPSNHESGRRYEWAVHNSPLDGVAPANIPEWFEGDQASIPTGSAQVARMPAGVPMTDKLLADLESALPTISADDYHQWVRIGMALHSTGAGDQAFQLWDRWSAGSDKYDPGACATKWESFGRGRGETVSISTVFHDAKAAGWVEPLVTSQPVLPPIDPANLPWTDAGVLAANITPPDWLIKGFLERDSFCQLFGPHSVGKSFLALDWAMSVATGHPWNGQRVNQGLVLYIAGEGQNGLKRRIKAWCMEHDYPVGKPLGIMTSNRPRILYDEPEAAQVHQEALLLAERAGGDPVLIVVDTLARAFGGGDENSSKDMGVFIKHVTKYLQEDFRATVLVVHHSGHGAAARGRGSSSLPAALDIDYQLAREGADYRRLTNQKMKDALPPDEQFFRLKVVDLGAVDEDNEPVTSCVLESVDKDDVPTAEHGAEVAEGLGIMSEQTHKKRPGRAQSKVVEIIESMAEQLRDQGCSGKVEIDKKELFRRFEDVGITKNKKYDYKRWALDFTPLEEGATGVIFINLDK